MTAKVSRAAFEPESANASLARRFLTSTLQEWHCDRIADTAILLVGELVANVVLHAQTAFEVTVHLEGQRLRVEVGDADARLPTRKHYSATSTTGRGLTMLDELADSWGAESTAGGKRVWFELEIGPVARRSDTMAIDLETLELDDAVAPEARKVRPTSAEELDEWRGQARRYRDRHRMPLPAGR